MTRRSILTVLTRGAAWIGGSGKGRTSRVAARSAAHAGVALVAAASLAIVLAPAASHAAWQTGGNLLGSLGFGGRLHSPSPFAVPEAPGSCLVSRGFTPSRLWRIDAGGDTLGIWPDPAIYPGAPGYYGGYSIFTPDGAGGFIALWDDFRNGKEGEKLYAQRITAAGSIAPGWPDSGAALSGVVSAADMQMVPDGSGGAFVTWVAWSSSDLYVQHVSGTGLVAAPGGVQVMGPVAGTQLDDILIGDGDGRAIIVWVDRWNATPDQYAYDLYAQRVDRDLNLAWGPTGAVVTTAAYRQDRPVALPDGTGGAFIAWLDQRNTAINGIVKQDIYALHLTSSGAPAPGWAQGGSPVRIATWAVDVRIASDGAGGAFISSAERQGGSYDLQVADYPLSGGSSMFREWLIPGMNGPSGRNNTRLHDLVADGSSGAYVAWTADYGDFVLHLGPDGEPAPGWGPDGVRVDVDQWDYAGGVMLASDGEGGAFVIFERCRDERIPHEPSYEKLLYATRVLSGNPGPLQVAPSPASHFVLDGAQPNPTGRELTVAFELPDGAPAWIELMDLSGRRMIAREVGAMGPGQHRMPLGDSRDLAPGMYFVRLTRGGRALTTRVAVVR